MMLQQAVCATQHGASYLDNHFSPISVYTQVTSPKHFTSMQHNDHPFSAPNDNGQFPEIPLVLGRTSVTADDTVQDSHQNVPPATQTHVGDLDRFENECIQETGRVFNDTVNRPIQTNNSGNQIAQEEQGVSLESLLLDANVFSFNADPFSDFITQELCQFYNGSDHNRAAVNDRRMYPPIEFTNSTDGVDLDEAADVLSADAQQTFGCHGNVAVSKDTLQTSERRKDTTDASTGDSHFSWNSKAVATSLAALQTIVSSTDVTATIDGMPNSNSPMNTVNTVATTNSTMITHNTIDTSNCATHTFDSMATHGDTSASALLSFTDLLESPIDVEEGLQWASGGLSSSSTLTGATDTSFSGHINDITLNDIQTITSSNEIPLSFGHHIQSSTNVPLEQNLTNSCVVAEDPTSLVLHDLDDIKPAEMSSYHQGAENNLHSPGSPHSVLSISSSSSSYASSSKSSNQSSTIMMPKFLSQSTPMPSPSAFKVSMKRRLSDGGDCLDDFNELERDRKPRLITPQLPPCRICGFASSGFHYGANTCEACKGFFRRALRKKAPFVCAHSKNCNVKKERRNLCGYCRYQLCLKEGMGKAAIKTGRHTHEKRTQDILEVRRLQEEEAMMQEKMEQEDFARIVQEERLKNFLSIGPNGEDVVRVVAELVGAHSRGLLLAVRETDAEISKKTERFKYQFQLQQEIMGIMGASSEEVMPGQTLFRLDAIESGSPPSPAFQKTSKAWILDLLGFVRAIPGFSALSVNDQHVLLKESCSELWMLGAYRGFSEQHKVAYLPNTICRHKDEITKVYGPDFAQLKFDLASILQRLDLDENEVVILKAICVCSPDRHFELENRSAVERILDLLLVCLQHVTNKSRPQTRVASAIGRAMTALTSIRELSSAYWQLPCVVRRHQRFTEEMLLAELSSYTPEQQDQT